MLKCDYRQGGGRGQSACEARGAWAATMAFWRQMFDRMPRPLPCAAVCADWSPISLGTTSAPAPSPSPTPASNFSPLPHVLRPPHSVRMTTACASPTASSSRAMSCPAPWTSAAGSRPRCLTLRRCEQGEGGEASLVFVVPQAHPAHTATRTAWMRSPYPPLPSHAMEEACFCPSPPFPPAL